MEMEKNQDTGEIELNPSENPQSQKRRVPRSPTLGRPRTKKKKPVISTVTNLFVLIALFSVVLALQYINSQSRDNEKDTVQTSKETPQVIEKSQVTVTETKEVKSETAIVDLSSLEKTTTHPEPRYAPKATKARTRARTARRRDIYREDRIMSDKLVDQLDGRQAHQSPHCSTSPVASSYDTSTRPAASSYSKPVESYPSDDYSTSPYYDDRIESAYYVNELDSESARQHYIANNRASTTPK